ncbi:MAG: hypothetical protein IJP27_07260 [Clostridia bacterium]|nr:hypothetical protein [Clostridia bacterium]
MIKDYLSEQVRRHPSSQPQDLIKHCYQAAFGSEHLLADFSAAFARFTAEFEAVLPQKMPLFEPLSEEICRINLAAWKQEGLPPAWLFRIFAATAAKKGDLEKNLREAGELGLFPAAEWEKCLQEYRAAGMPAVHHSAAYRAAEKPAYCLADRRFLRLLPILRAAARSTKNPCIIAIDGRAASGKSTVGQQLRQILEGSLLHMDDFFLPPALRTVERLKENGGNVHYERFAEEVLPFLAGDVPFSYRIFDCSKMDFNGERRVEPKQFRIVEGSYSHHPAFGNYADITVFSSLEPEEQQERILRRDGEELLRRFQECWIPWEEQYFAACRIAESASIII